MSSKFAKIFYEDFKKYGKVEEDGTIILDSGIQSQIIGKVHKDNVKKLIGSYYNKTDLAKSIFKEQPYFYDENKIWWLWNSKNFRWEIVDETDMLNMIRISTNENTVNSKEKAEIIESLKQEGRLRRPKEIKKTWIQFQNKIVDFTNEEEFLATPEYFVTNPIPWELNRDKFVNTPKIDNLFKEWVGEENIKTLYQILAYCLVPDYPIHRLFCFIGEGMNGKSCFLRLLTKFVGKENVCSTELDSLLNSRFEITKLHKKLVCMMGETNFAEMEKTSTIKRLTGQDAIGFEYKNKNPFDDTNYAKILIATNNLPTTSDKTIGFYRRWMIIEFPNRFSEQEDILSSIPEEEYGILARKCLILINDLIKERKFYNEGSVEDRKKNFEEHSNPFDKFWRENIVEDVDSDISKTQFKKKLDSWCKENRFRSLSDVTISKHMNEKEIETSKLTMEWIDVPFGQKKPRYNAWVGIKFKGENN